MWVGDSREQSTAEEKCMTRFRREAVRSGWGGGEWEESEGRDPKMGSRRQGWRVAMKAKGP